MDGTAERIAEEFLRRYEAAWADGAETVAELYTSDSVLVGYVTAVGRSEILKLVQRNYRPGLDANQKSKP